MHWQYLASLVLVTLLLGIDCKSAKLSNEAEEDGSPISDEDVAANEAQVKKAPTDDETALHQGGPQSKPGASSEEPDADQSSQEGQGVQADPRNGRRRRRKNRNRRRSRRHGYRAYKRKFHNEKDYYYLKRILEPDSGMVRDVATLDDIVTLDSMDDDLPKRRKRDANAQANDDSCSDSDDD